MLVDTRHFLPADRLFLDRLPDITAVHRVEVVSSLAVSSSTPSAASALAGRKAHLHVGASHSALWSIVQIAASNVPAPISLRRTENPGGVTASGRTFWRLESSCLGTMRLWRRTERGCSGVTVVESRYCVAFIALAASRDRRPPQLPNPYVVSRGILWCGVPLTTGQSSGFAKSSCS